MDTKGAHSIQYTVYSVQCTVYSVQCTVYSIQYKSLIEAQLQSIHVAPECYQIDRQDAARSEPLGLDQLKVLASK